MLNPMGKRNELLKQRRTFCRRKMTLRKPCLHTDPHPCRVEKAHLWSPGLMHPSLLPRIFPTELARNRGLEAGGKRKEDEAKAPLRPTARSQLVTPPRPGVDPRCKQASYSQGPAARAAALLHCWGILQRNWSALLPYFQQPTSTENNHLDDDINHPEVEPAVLEPERLESPKDTAVRTRPGRRIRSPERPDF